MRRKEYAVSLGLATPGKGRMSREALAAIDRARNEGMSFDDDVPVIRTPRAPVVASAPRLRVSAKAESDSNVGSVYHRYPYDQIFTGTDSQGRVQKVNARAICRNSRYSIAGCPCDSHVALVPSMEVITVE